MVASSIRDTPPQQPVSRLLKDPAHGTAHGKEREKLLLMRERAVAVAAQDIVAKINARLNEIS
jgi:hypothetical protein